MGSLLADIIYLSTIKMETTNEQVQRETTSERETMNRKPSKYAGLGAAMAADLMIGFWFGIRAILAVKMVQSLEYCIKELISRK